MKNNNSTASHPRSATFARIADWVKPAAADVATFFSAFALLELEGGWVRLRKDDQRALLGCAPFGHCSLFVADNNVTVFRSVCFGTDAEINKFSAHELSELIAAGRTARPGIYSNL